MNPSPQPRPDIGPRPVHRAPTRRPYLGPVCGTTEDAPVTSTNPANVTCEDCATLHPLTEMNDEASGNDPDRIRVLRAILTDRQAKKLSGVLVDIQTARVVLAVYEALKPEHRPIYATLPLRRMVDIAWRATTRTRKESGGTR